MCKECENEVKENKKHEKVRKVFLDELPIRGKTNQINWKESAKIKAKVKFIYDNIEGEVEIADYDGKYLSIKYKDEESFKIKTNNFSRGILGELLKEELYTYNYDESNPRRVDLRGLPLNSKGIDWTQVANNKMKIPFEYEDIKGEVEIVDYKPKGQFIYIKYQDEPIFKIKAGHFSNCALGNLVGVYTDKFKIEIGIVFKDEKRDITIIDRKHFKNEKDGIVYKVYKYHCNKCGFECGEHYKNGVYQEEFWITESGLLNGNGCACCCHNPQVVVEHINSIVAKEGTYWMIQCFQGGHDEAKLYTKSSGQKIYPVCPDCGRVREKEIRISDIYKYHSIGCGCSDGQSYPNKLCFALLEQLGINFINEYSPEWIKPKRYDFYFEINNKKYIVEMDGGLGHGRNIHKLSGQTKEETKLIDEYKDLKAKEHGIEVIRIDSQESELEYIKNNILNSELTKLFDLSIIDWLKVEEFALSNLCKKVCKLKRENPNLSPNQIARIMKLSPDTIRNYLKKGSKIWDWCKYDPKEETIKSGSKIGKLKGKPIEIFKDGKSLGKFLSVSDLERQSEERFGVRLLQGNMSAVCREEKSQYKGFTFKYLN